MIRSTAVTTKTISTLLLLLVLLVVLGYSASTAVRAIVIIVAFLWTIFRRGTKIQLHEINGMHLLWAVSIIILVHLSRYWALVPQGVDDVKNNVLWACMITIIMADYVAFYRVSIEKIAKILLPVTIIFLLSALIFGSRGLSNRLSVSNNANTFGMVAAGMMNYYLFLTFKTKKKGYIALSLLLLVVILLSGSRKSTITMTIFFVGYYEFMEQSKNTAKTIGRIIAIICILLAVYAIVMNVEVLYNAIGNRIESLLGFLFKQEEADSSVFSRLNMISLASNIIREHPILGIGANNFKYYTYYNTYSHNGYTEIMCSFGIVGIIVYYLPLLFLFFMSLKNWQQHISGAILPLCVFIAFFVCEMFGVTYFSYHNYCFIGLASGLAFNMKRDR